MVKSSFYDKNHTPETLAKMSLVNNKKYMFIWPSVLMREIHLVNINPLIIVH